MEDLWCVIGDFNSLLYAGDRRGGTSVLDSEIAAFADTIQACGLQEPPHHGSYYSWTNKKVWSRIDRAFINTLWYDQADFTQVKYLPQSLSDHTPLMLQITASPKTRPSFQFCDMWTLNRGKYKDLREQQRTARAALEHLQQALANDPTNDSLLQQERKAQRHYISIISSTLDITRQQCKVDWIKYRDAETRFFYAKAKQRKLQTYVYSLRDDDGLQHHGFDAVSRVQQDYYSSLLGNPTPGAPLDPTIIAMGPILSLEQQQPLCAPFAERDIKDAFFSIPGIKSPGLDGFNSTFYKAAWDSHGP
ncbi:hypothetical protein Cgig2_000524 [Carnegiea gigantea]|uniref:Endonuclease/exonuclease/phosphatase domain-containing protein n=1 Tax=Carnegiea gigantea TaxID=171969 RepID=A0A9Q1GKT5_9CARY|nr:hypothetical protein Cgig2_000524 [Carnegiea gigantea]